MQGQDTSRLAKRNRKSTQRQQLLLQGQKMRNPICHDLPIPLAEEKIQKDRLRQVRKASLLEKRPTQAARKGRF